MLLQIAWSPKKAQYRLAKEAQNPICWDRKPYTRKDSGTAFVQNKHPTKKMYYLPLLHRPNTDSLMKEIPIHLIPQQPGKNDPLLEQHAETFLLHDEVHLKKTVFGFVVEGLKDIECNILEDLLDGGAKEDNLPSAHEGTMFFVSAVRLSKNTLLREIPIFLFQGAHTEVLELHSLENKEEFDETREQCKEERLVDFQGMVYS